MRYEQIDRRIGGLRPLDALARPPLGWVRTIRDCLGMTTRQLAKRVGVSQPRIVKIEKAELDAAITLESLQRVAKALDCRLVYALIPNKPLKEMLTDRATAIADQHLAAVEQTMRLEAQEVADTGARQILKDQLTQQLLRHPARLWDDV